MPLYRATIHKGIEAGGPSWSNVYNLLCSDAFVAGTTAQAVAEIESAVTYDIVFFGLIDIINVADKTDRLTVAMNINGSLNHDTVGVQLPLYCTTLVTFTDRVKKPEKKFIRSPGWSDRITAGASWDSAWILNFHNNYMNPLLDMPEFVGPNGERPSEATVHNPIWNRQLGWNRRTRPGFKRGWVPV